MTGRWQAALAWALTGEEFSLAETGRPDVARLIASLAEAGWTSERIAAHAGEVVGECPWPHPVPDSLRSGCGAAQFAAALGAARLTLGVATLETRPPSIRRELSPAEERLMREVPPHHVG